MKTNILYTGDLYEEDQILNWLMTQKDPGGDVIEDLEGQRLIDLIEESGSMAVYFCKFSHLFMINMRGCHIQKITPTSKQISSAHSSNEIENR